MLHHWRHEELRQVGEGRDVHADHIELAGDLGFHELAAESEAGVVDEGVDRDVFVLNEIEDRLRRGGLAEIGGEDLTRDTEFALELTRSGFESIALPRNQDEIEIIARENLRELEADASGATRDESGGTV